MNASSKVGSGQGPLEVILELHVDVLAQGHVGGHEDKLVVASKGATTLVLKIDGATL